MPNHQLPISMACLLVAIASPAWGQLFDTMIDNGPSSNRVDIIYVGDGYRASEIEGSYVQHIQVSLDHMFGGSQSPFPRYSDFFNVHRVNVISSESGADKPPQNIFVDTALDASYWWDGVTQRLLYLSTSKANTAVNNALSGTGIDVDMRIATVNDTMYGGGGGQWAVYAGGNNSAPELALHELGHSFAGLADEYYSIGTTYTGGELNQPNVTNSPSTGKWDRWLGYDDPDTNIGPIDYYEGGRYFQFGIYRPSSNSKMRSLNRPFDAVGREQFIEAIYDEVDPLDDWLDPTTPLVNPSSLWVDTVDPTVIQVAWNVDGNPQGVFGETLEVAGLELTPGSYQLTALASDMILDHAFTGDALDWWRLPDASDLRQSITWQITVGSGDFDLDGVFSCEDVDSLVDAIANHSVDSQYDLTLDGQVDPLDLDRWLENAGRAQLPSGNPYLIGDANLDGVVDASDFNRWNSNKFTSAAAWCSGDFNADGPVDASDFNLWNANKFSSALDPLAVPESGAAAVLSGVLLLAFQIRRYGNRELNRCP